MKTLTIARYATALLLLSSCAQTGSVMPDDPQDASATKQSDKGIPANGSANASPQLDGSTSAKLNSEGADALSRSLSAAESQKYGEALLAAGRQQGLFLGGIAPGGGEQQGNTAQDPQIQQKMQICAALPGATMTLINLCVACTISCASTLSEDQTACATDDATICAQDKLALMAGITPGIAEEVIPDETVVPEEAIAPDEAAAPAVEEEGESDYMARRRAEKQAEKDAAEEAEAPRTKTTGTVTTSDTSSGGSGGGGGQVSCIKAVFFFARCVE